MADTPADLALLTREELETKVLQLEATVSRKEGALNLLRAQLRLMKTVSSSFSASLGRDVPKPTHAELREGGIMHPAHAALCDKFEDWCLAYGLVPPDGGAEELSKDPLLSTPQREWLSRFLADWNDINAETQV